MIVRYTTKALVDIARVRRFIAADSVSSAHRVARDLFASCDALAELPLRGRPGLRTGTRELVVPPYVIVYRVRSGEVEISSVWHAAQNRQRSER